MVRWTGKVTLFVLLDYHAGIKTQSVKAKSTARKQER